MFAVLWPVLQQPQASLVIVIVGVAEQLLEPFWQSAYFLLNGFAMVALLCLAGFKSK
jgi:hypothetical protein